MIRPSNIPGVDIIPGSMAAAEFNTPNPFNAPAEVQVRLRNFLDEARLGYDVVLIDNPPNLSRRDVGRPDRVRLLPLLPVIPEDYGTASLSPVLESIRLVASGPNPSIVNLGMVLTMVQPRLSVHIVFEDKPSRGNIMAPGVFNARVPMASDIKEAIFHHKPVSHHKPRGTSAKAIKALADEMLSKIVMHEAPQLLEVGTNGQV